MPSTSPKKNKIVTQELADHTTTEDNDDNDNTSNKSRLYQLGLLCASPGLTKDKLTKEMLSNIDKSNIIKHDQRNIISNINANEEEAAAAAAATDKSNNNTSTKQNEKVPQTISFQVSNASSTTSSSSSSSTTSSKFNSSSRGSISLKRNRIPPPLNLSANKKSHKGDVVTSTTTKKKPMANNRLKYFSRSRSNNNNNHNNNNTAKSAPPNILHFPGRNSKSQSSSQEPQRVADKNTLKMEKPSQTQSDIPFDPSMYPYYPYPTNIPPQMMGIPSAAPESNPHFYNPYAYSQHPQAYSQHPQAYSPHPQAYSPYPPPGYMMPYPYMYHSPPYSNLSTAVQERQMEQSAAYPDTTSFNYPGDYTDNYPGNYPGNHPEPQPQPKQQDTITGDIRIMNNIFTFEFPHNEALDKDTFSSICNKIWNEHIELSKK